MVITWYLRRFLLNMLILSLISGLLFLMWIKWTSSSFILITSLLNVTIGLGEMSNSSSPKQTKSLSPFPPDYIFQQFFFLLSKQIINPALSYFDCLNKKYPTLFSILANISKIYLQWKKTFYFPFVNIHILFSFQKHSWKSWNRDFFSLFLS